MNRTTRTLFFVFWILTAAELLLIYFQQTSIRWFTKPLLMPVLMIAFYSASNSKKGKLFYFILLALFLSWAGDVLLMMKNMFIPGLVSFLLAHIFYIIYFLQTNRQKKGLLQFQPLIGLPVIIYIAIFLWQLYPFLDALKIPVTVYAITIGTMLIMAINTRRKVDDDAAVLFFNGALQFVISDSLLAVNLFAVNNLLLGLCVMLTYCSAQYLIVKGALLNKE